MILGDQGVSAMSKGVGLVDSFRRSWLAHYNGGHGWRVGPVYTVAIKLGVIQPGAAPIQQRSRPRSAAPRRDPPGRDYRSGDADTSESDAAKRPRLSGPERAERWGKLSSGP